MLDTPPNTTGGAGLHADPDLENHNLKTLEEAVNPMEHKQYKILKREITERTGRLKVIAIHPDSVFVYLHPPRPAVHLDQTSPQIL